MNPAARSVPALLVLLVMALAGCTAPAPVEPTSAPPTDLVPNLGPVKVTADNLMHFTQSVVSSAVAVAADLYEPTMEVSDTGTLYVAAHVIGAASTGTPAWFSRDDGKTWAQLPLAASAAAPSPIQGAQPPPGDEGFLVAGDNGQAWMADIYAYGFSVTGWCGDGASQCYDDRQAYDRVASTTSCSPDSLNDRPWAAYANGSLLLVNNPGNGVMQLGMLQVPPPLPVGFGVVNGPTWNMCANQGGSIPGIPAMRSDGLFAVPQVVGSGEDRRLVAVMGHKEDISKVEPRDVFKFTSAGGGTINSGQTTFDRDGTLYAGVRNNTEKEGFFLLAVSRDDGQSFQTTTFSTGTQVQSLYLDGNMAGPGALVSWSQVGSDEGLADWYVAHAFVGPDGSPTLSNVTLAVDEGPPYAAHVMGAGAGPDGRAYFVNFARRQGDATQYAGSTPISVWVQQDGPTLPVAATPAAAG